MSILEFPRARASEPERAPIRVMVVDDAVVVRGLISRWIGEEPDLKAVASLRTGDAAIEQFERTDPDVVVLDIDMPGLDGLSTLPLLLEKKRDLVVIMASTLTRLNAEISFKALSLGAADYIPKPETQGGVTGAAGITGSGSFRRELIEKIRALGERARVRRRLREPVQSPSLVPDTPYTQPVLRPRVPLHSSPVTLRPFPAIMPRVLVIGASTGGPQALTTIVSRIGPVLDTAPVLITQHMPPTFTTILAEQLATISGRAAREGEDGEPVLAGRIYVAPGGRHMRVVRRDGAAVITLDDGPPVNFCRPSVDPLFSSAAATWGPWNLGLILTGMGTDGSAGAAAIANAGGCVIAQDEATSVVWGMPGAAAESGVCSAVLPLDQIAPKITRLFSGSRP